MGELREAIRELVKAEAPVPEGLEGRIRALEEKAIFTQLAAPETVTFHDVASSISGRVYTFTASSRGSISWTMTNSPGEMSTQQVPSIGDSLWFCYPLGVPYGSPSNGGSVYVTLNDSATITVFAYVGFTDNWRSRAVSFHLADAGDEISRYQFDEAAIARIDCKVDLNKTGLPKGTKILIKAPNGTVRLGRVGINIVPWE